MHRFKMTELGEQVFWLRDQERDHLVRVLRLGVGDKVVGYDNTGAEHLGVVECINEKSVTCRILSSDYPEVEAKTEVYLVAGLSKGEKMEWVIQKGTELGMAGLVPLRTRRAVMKLEGEKARERVDRWQKIAVEAAKQSHRVHEPKIYPVSAWQEMSDLLPRETQWIIPYEEEKARGLNHVLAQLDQNKPVAVLIGPEGGFDPQEVEKAVHDLSAFPVSLGPRILRAETAALAALTLVLGYWGDLG